MHAKDNMRLESDNPHPIGLNLIEMFYWKGM